MKTWRINRTWTHYEIETYEAPAWRLGVRWAASRVGAYRLAAWALPYAARRNVARFPIEQEIAAAIDPANGPLTTVCLGAGPITVSNSILIRSGVAVSGGAVGGTSFGARSIADQGLMERSGVQFVPPGSTDVEIQAAIDRAASRRQRDAYDRRFPS